MMLKCVPQSKLYRKNPSTMDGWIGEHLKHPKTTSPHFFPTVFATPKSRNSLNSCPCVSSTERANSLGGGTTGAWAAPATSPSVTRPGKTPKSSAMSLGMSSGGKERPLGWAEHREGIVGLGWDVFLGSVPRLELQEMRRCWSLAGFDFFPPLCGLFFLGLLLVFLVCWFCSSQASSWFP